jgi:hypothetical protein
MEALSIVRPKEDPWIHVRFLLRIQLTACVPLLAMLGG